MKPGFTPRHTAYLLVHMQIVNGQPFQVVTGAGIYSEQYPTTMGGSMYALLFSAEGESFQKAHDAVMEIVCIRPHLHWLLPWLDDSLDAHMRRYDLGKMIPRLIKKVSKYLRARTRQMAAEDRADARALGSGR